MATDPQQDFDPLGAIALGLEAAARRQSFDHVITSVRTWGPQVEAFTNDGRVLRFYPDHGMICLAVFGDVRYRQILSEATFDGIPVAVIIACAVQVATVGRWVR